MKTNMDAMEIIKKEKIKKNVYLILSCISAFIFIAGLLCTILGDDSPVKFIINGSPIKLIALPVLVFLLVFSLYRNSKKIIEENSRNIK